MDTHVNAPLTPKGREAMVRAVDASLNDGRLSNTALFVARHMLRSFGWL